MEGRLEHKLENERLIKRWLPEMPPLVTDYYLSRASSKESSGNVAYLTKLRLFLRYLNEDMKKVDVTNITEGDVSRFLHSIEQTTDNKGNAKETSFSYRKQMHTVLNSFFEYLRKKRVITENPMDCIERPASNDIVKRRRLDSWDMHFILECIDGGAGTDHAKNRSKPWRKRDKAILTLLIMTGMRETALTEINVDDVDFINNTIRVVDKRHKTHIYTINKVMREALENWIADREEKLAGADIDALFISKKQSPHRLCAGSIENIVKKYSLEGLGYSVSPHKLRAAFCTIMYEETHDIEFVRRAVGHSSINTTLKYVVDDDTAKAEVAEYMEKMFG